MQTNDLIRRGCSLEIGHDRVFLEYEIDETATLVAAPFPRPSPGLSNEFLLFVITDERDAIQKKTFTKWVNKHLKKVSLSDRRKRALSTLLRQSMGVHRF